MIEIHPSKQSAYVLAQQIPPPSPPSPLTIPNAVIPVSLTRSKAKTRSLYDTCWDVRVYFLAPATTESHGALVRRFDPSFGDIEVQTGRCSDVEDNGVQVLVVALAVWDPTSPSCIGTLCHECFHATQYILERRGVKLNDDTSEVYAYLLDSLVRRGNILLSKGISPNMAR